MIRLVSVTKAYGRNGGAPEPETSPVLADVDFSLPDGETLVIRGESGSGKTTLLNLIAGLDRPTHGEVWVDGHRIDTLDDDALARYRRDTVGVVFQSFHLEQQLTSEENVELPLLLGNVARTEARDRAREALKAVRMDTFAHKRVSFLSGGQRQRVVLARAIVRRPRLLLADEPTANLDSETGRVVLDCLADYQARENATLLLVSHDPLALAHPGWRQAVCENATLRFTG